MKRKKILIFSGVILLFLVWGLSMFGLYLRERGYFLESQKIRQYQRFLDFDLPQQMDLFYRISLLDRPIGYFYSGLEGHFEDYYYNKKQELMVMFTEITEMPVYIKVSMESSHNMDGSLMFQSGKLEVNRDTIRIQGNVVDKSAIFDLEYRDENYNMEFELPDQYMTIDLLSPLNIRFSEFVLQETYELESFFPHMIDLPRTIYLTMEDIEDITIMGRNFRAYRVHIFDETRTFSSRLWVDSNNRILRQTFQDYIEIERIEEKDYLELVEHYEERKDATTWRQLPDLSPLLEGRWWQALSL